MPKVSHFKAFTTPKRAGCACGYTVEAGSRKQATQRLINHLLHPSSANTVADTPADHPTCTLVKWDERWSVCTEHNAYVDKGSETRLSVQGVLEYRL